MANLLADEQPQPSLNDEANIQMPHLEEDVDQIEDAAQIEDVEQIDQVRKS